MNFFLSYFFAARFWSGKKEVFASFVTIVAVLGVTLGTASLIIVTSVMDGLEKQQSIRMFKASSHIVLSPDVAITSEDLTKIAANLRKNIPNIASIVFGFDHNVLLKSAYSVQGKVLQGIDSTSPSYNRLQKHIAIDIKELKRRPYSIILGHALAVQMGVDIGDYVTVMSSSGAIYSLFGSFPIQKKFQVIGYHSAYSKEDKDLVITDIEYAINLAGKSLDKAKSLNIKLKQPYLVDNSIANITSIYPDLFEIRSWRSVFGFQLEAIKMEKRIMLVMLSLVILVAAFNIASALFILVNDKRKEVAILKTLGFLDRNILFIFVLQGMISGILGLILGLILGITVSINLIDILNYFDISALNLIAINLDYFKVFHLMLFTIIVVFLSSLYPAFYAFRVYPAKVLRHE